MTQDATSQPSPSPQASPFPSDKRTADIIIRTSDSVDFYVHKVILLHASSVFKDMFDLPQPSQNNSSESSIPVVDVSEDSHTWITILRICYPIAKPMRPFAEIEPALSAAQKYDMELPLAVLTQNLIAAAPEHSILVWAVACRAGLENVARLAAMHIKSQNLSCAVRVSAGDYFRLLQFLNCKGKVAKTFRFLETEPSPASPAVVQSGDHGTAAGNSQGAFCATVPYPDVTCCSEDGVEFPTHRGILAIVSPVLRKRLAALKTTSGGTSSSLPVIYLKEVAKGELLKYLLDAFYEHPERIPKVPSDLAATMVAAEGLEMAKGWEALSKQWDEAAKKHPLAAYFAAAEHRWADRAKRAAVYHLLDHPLLDAYSPAMEDYPMILYRRLLKFYEECESAVETEIEAVRATWQEGFQRSLEHLRQKVSLSERIRRRFSMSNSSAPTITSPAGVSSGQSTLVLAVAFRLLRRGEQRQSPPGSPVAKASHGRDSIWSSSTDPWNNNNDISTWLEEYVRWRVKGKESSSNKEVVDYYTAVSKRLEGAVRRVSCHIET